MAYLLYPLTSEKAASKIERQNTLTFIVRLDANKQALKLEVEKTFGEKVVCVNTQVTPTGRKKATVRFARPGAAADVAAKLKLV